jgi:hypothetical protein
MTDDDATFGADSGAGIDAAAQDTDFGPPDVDGWGDDGMADPESALFDAGYGAEGDPGEHTPAAHAAAQHASGHSSGHPAAGHAGAQHAAAHGGAQHAAGHASGQHVAGHSAGHPAAGHATDQADAQLTGDYPGDEFMAPDDGDWDPASMEAAAGDDAPDMSDPTAADPA